MSEGREARIEQVEPPEQRQPEALPKSRRGEIVSAVAADGRVALTVRVREEDGDREYTGSLAVEVLARLEPAEQRRALVEAVRLERDRRRRLESIDLAALTGDVELW